MWMGTEDIVGEMALLFRDEFDQVTQPAVAGLAAGGRHGGRPQR